MGTAVSPLAGWLGVGGVTLWSQLCPAPRTCPVYMGLGRYWRRDAPGGHPNSEHPNRVRSPPQPPHPPPPCLACPPLSGLISPRTSATAGSTQGRASHHGSLPERCLSRRWDTCPHPFQRTPRHPLKSWGNANARKKPPGATFHFYVELRFFLLLILPSPAPLHRGGSAASREMRPHPGSRDCPHSP